uniref:Uncharacterized protein n=1 Tax=Triticum urartu TaxID=4572 RepID=A0A8R7Q4A9_TRIUA
RPASSSSCCPDPPRLLLLPSGAPRLPGATLLSPTLRPPPQRRHILPRPRPSRHPSPPPPLTPARRASLPNPTAPPRDSPNQARLPHGARHLPGQPDLGRPEGPTPCSYRLSSGGRWSQCRSPATH